MRIIANDVIPEMGSGGSNPPLSAPKAHGISCGLFSFECPTVTHRTAGLLRCETTEAAGLLHQASIEDGRAPGAAVSIPRPAAIWITNLNSTDALVKRHKKL